jgi:alpha-L-fucosidase
MPNVGPDLKPRTLTHTSEERAAHEKAFAEEVRGQITELLTRYGKIDLLWFDGKPAIPDGDKVISIEEIRRLQPGIVMNPRLHGRGDFVTYERKLGTDKVATGWAEFCNTWTNNWSHVVQPFRSNAYVLGQLAQSRSLGINYLLGVGPTKDGEFVDEIYQNMDVVAGWMKANGPSVLGARPLPAGEKASVPATSRGHTRYLFAIPEFKGDGAYPKDQLPAKDETLTLSGVAAEPKGVRLLGSDAPLRYAYADGKVSVDLPASVRTDLVDVVCVELP